MKAELAHWVKHPSNHQRRFNVGVKVFQKVIVRLNDDTCLVIATTDEGVNVTSNTLPLTKKYTMIGEIDVPDDLIEDARLLIEATERLNKHRRKLKDILK